MDAQLAIDTTSGAWRAVREYAEARIAALTDRCVAVAAADDQRRAAAERIDELRELLSAPTRTRAMTEQRASAREGAY